MAKHVLGPNTTVSWNGTALGNHATNVTLEDSADEVDITGFSETYREFIPGLKDATATVTFLQDYASTSVDEVLGASYYANTAGTLKVNPDTSGTVVYTLAPARIYSFGPVSGGVGDANTIDVTFRNAGTVGLTRGTA